ncbi:MAG: twin-arginine translocase TatA/TatE family subunit [Planctomycetaceae bacterium]|jgi:sec-independent protein translocase protein TatA|nr:twin-arginine translocase TatA/TatE family subunit [Planctomycetaceae bacterium]
MSGVFLFGFLGASSPVTLIVVAAVAFLLFGNRLPQVMRSLGRSVVEFKKGVNGIEDDLDDAVRSADKKANTKSDEAEA